MKKKPVPPFVVTVRRGASPPSDLIKEVFEGLPEHWKDTIPPICFRVMPWDQLSAASQRSWRAHMSSKDWIFRYLYAKQDQGIIESYVHHRDPENEPRMKIDILRAMLDCTIEVRRHIKGMIRQYDEEHEGELDRPAVSVFITDFPLFITDQVPENTPEEIRAFFQKFDSALQDLNERRQQPVH